MKYLHIAFLLFCAVVWFGLAAGWVPAEPWIVTVSFAVVGLQCLGSAAGKAADLFE